MHPLIIVAAVVVLLASIIFFEMLRVPAGIERECRIEAHKIFSRTRTVTGGSLEEVVRLLETDWSWWKKARAASMQDLGDGRKEFLFHPIRFFDLILELQETRV